jgi:hypothetical protein
MCRAPSTIWAPDVWRVIRSLLAVTEQVTALPMMMVSWRTSNWPRSAPSHSPPSLAPLHVVPAAGVPVAVIAAASDCPPIIGHKRNLRLSLGPDVVTSVRRADSRGVGSPSVRWMDFNMSTGPVFVRGGGSVTTVLPCDYGYGGPIFRLSGSSGVCGQAPRPDIGGSGGRPRVAAVSERAGQARRSASDRVRERAEILQGPGAGRHSSRAAAPDPDVDDG